MNPQNKLFFLAKSISSKLDKFIPITIKNSVKDYMIHKELQKYLATNKIPYQKGVYQEGINLIGSIKAEMGLGQSCRLIANMIKESRYNFSIYNYDFGGKVKEGDTSFDHYIVKELPYSINIFHVNPCELGNLFMSMPNAWNSHYNIAFWLWELEEFPNEWIAYCKLFDEIWTPSEFTRKTIQNVTDVPVKVLPYYVSVPNKKNIGREYFSLPNDQFLFLVMYDINSTEGRKNPQGAINAFKNAFRADNQQVGLVIKVNNGSPEQIHKLKMQLTGYKNIYYITETLDKECTNSLIKCCDVFVSLHRAEGFGLVMAEAMLLRTPVIATNWSSNTEFMNKKAACMVDFHIVENPKTEGLYRKGCLWAEPNYIQAAEFMEKLWQNPHYYAEKQDNGEDYIQNVLNKDKLVNLLIRYIEETI